MQLRLAFACYAAISVLSACTTQLTQVRAPSEVNDAYAGHRDRFQPAAFKGKVLFIADATWPNGLYIYSLPGLKRIKTVTGLDAPPSALCADAGGDVWVTFNSARTVTEYSHTGVQENTVTLPDGQHPQSCAFAPNGDFAVTTIPDGVGDAKITIYPGGPSGTPFSLSDLNADVENYLYLDYDANDNLYFDVTPRSTSVFSGLFECGAPCTASSSLVQIPLSGGPIYTAGMVEWDYHRGDLIIGDQTCDGHFTSCLYHVDPQAQKIVGVTRLKGPGGKPICDLAEGTLNRADDRMIGADLEDNEYCSHGTNEVYRWGYPSGKSQNRSSAPLEAPIAAAISIPTP